MRRLITLAIPMIGLFAQVAQAGIIVDTGPGPSNPIGFMVNGADAPFAIKTQSLGGEFALDSAFSITGIEGWLVRLPVLTYDAPETIHASIYSSSAGSPAERLFSTALSLPTCGSFSQQSCTPAWVGADGLQWQLGAGSYWAVFEGLIGDTGTAEMPAGVESPLTSYQFATSAQPWSSLAGPIGVRISGEAIATAVPEPTTLGLFVVAAIGLYLGRRLRARPRRLH